MKIAVIGAGGVGAPFGMAMALGGHEVTFVARGAHLKAMREEGLRVEGPLGDFHLPETRATDDPASVGPVDAVLFCVKLWDVESAGEAIKPLIGPDTFVIPIQNGIDAPDRLMPILGKDHVMGGVALIGGLIERPGVVRQTGKMRKVIYGELDGSRSDRAEAFLAACQGAGMDAELSADIRRSLWEKMVFLVSLSSVTAITRLPLGIAREDADLRALLLDVARETAAVGAAVGVKLADDFPENRLAYMDTQPATTMASMANDLVRGNRLELPWLAGKVVELGRTYGVDTPVTRTIYAALKPYVNGKP
ncbi:2-dehydropantoate 2-reductase [Constrictibacter sp. MBR-5]|jgi:2-dehydropantoate 2-reductase|uniref:ketopantoate reductase family protein n=1 Tax=Constrictibacter sp. MBR-5 TaxID=3156467 RepID=UPI003391242B